MNYKSSFLFALTIQAILCKRKFTTGLERSVRTRSAKVQLKVLSRKLPISGTVEWIGCLWRNRDCSHYNRKNAEREYYLKTDARTEGVRKAYKTYLVQTFMPAGNDSMSAVKNANSVFDFETRLAKSSRKLADLRDPYKNYNKMDVKGLSHL